MTSPRPGNASGFDPPSQEEGRAAFDRGQDDALRGRSRDAGPWSMLADSSRERSLASVYQLGYSVGVQVALQRRFGDPPTFGGGSPDQHHAYPRRGRHGKPTPPGILVGVLWW